MKKSEKGFTLVELLVVVAFIGILSAIAIPGIVSQLSHTRLTRNAREVSTELQVARLKAIANNNRYRVVFTLAGPSGQDSYRLNVYDSASNTWSADANRPLLNIHRNIDITSPGASFFVDFYPNGSAVATQICISNTQKTGDKMRVDVTGSTGMVTVRTGC